MQTEFDTFLSKLKGLNNYWTRALIDSLVHQQCNDSVSNVELADFTIPPFNYSDGLHGINFRWNFSDKSKH